MPDSDAVAIVGAARTPIGSFQGALGSLSAPELGSAAIVAALERAGLPPDEVDEVIMGCVLPAGLGQAPARQASLGAGIGLGTGCTTVNKMCGSGMKAVMLAHDLIRAGSATAMVAGGMESMTNAPYLLTRARGGMRMGHGAVMDHMFLDGLEDAYDKGRLMGTYAEDCADQYHFSREAQDAFAIESLRRARLAVDDGTFAAETVPVKAASRVATAVVRDDEQPGKADVARIPSLRPAFRSDGTVTAANSSSISDGAAALTLMGEGEARRRGIRPRARIVAHATYAQAPGLFTTAPVFAIRKLLARTNWTAADVDLYEINEAFAVVTMAAMKELDLSDQRVNVHGGACALGHPIGASGARILVTLLNAMERYDQRRGIASLCIGGGEATAMAIERID